MKNVSINGMKERDLDRRIRLVNGSLVIQKDKSEMLLGVYIVTSFRNQRHVQHSDTTNFCSLINLENGKIEFEEHCSRYTTVKRCLSHLTNAGNMNDDFNGQSLEIYANGAYKMNIDLSVTVNAEKVGGSCRDN